MAGINEQRRAKAGNAELVGRKAQPQPCQGLSWTPQTLRAALSALPMGSIWNRPQKEPPGPEPLLGLPPPPPTTLKRLLALNLPLLQLYWFFSWKIPPNQHPQWLLLLNFMWFWPASLRAHYFGTFGGKGNGFGFLMPSKIYWVNSSAEYSNSL